MDAIKTIKMVADELNVTKQTIVNNAKSLNISFEKENGINYINDNDCLKIIEKITKKESTTPNKEYIENLTKQLDQQNSNVNTLNKLLENQQILALESNKKIQKLENQLEEERHLNYSFDTATNDRQSVNPQEATFTEESQNINQQQKKTQPIEAEVNHEDITEEKKDDSPNEDLLAKDDKPSEEIGNGPEDREVEPPKKGFWSRLFGS